MSKTPRPLKSQKFLYFETGRKKKSLEENLVEDQNETLSININL